MVTYRGLAPAIQDLVSGQIDLMFVEQSTMMGHLAAGTIKAYAILAKSRSAAVPEIPTIEEAGGPPATHRHLARDVGAKGNTGACEQETWLGRGRGAERPSCAEANCRGRA